MGGMTTLRTPLGDVRYDAVAYDGNALTVTQDGLQSRAIAQITDDGVLVQRHGVDRFFAFYNPATAASTGIAGALTAPMPGNVIAVTAKAGDTVSAGDKLLVLEAMKMEHAITATQDGTIAELLVSEGDQVEQGALLVRMQDEG